MFITASLQQPYSMFNSIVERLDRPSVFGPSASTVSRRASDHSQNGVIEIGEGVVGIPATQYCDIIRYVYGLLASNLYILEEFLFYNRQ
jgi:hypothetical protein